LAKRARLQLVLRINDCALIGAVRRELEAARSGNGLVHATLEISAGRQATLLLGRDYTLDADLAARLARILGENSVDLSAQEPPRLALVG